MQVNLSSGNHKIIANGDAILFGHCEELVINIKENDFTVNLTLKFLQDNSGKARTENKVSGNNVVLSCFNFQGSGAGLSAPWHIANIANKKLYFVFWSFLHGTKQPKTRSVQYTVFYEI